MKKITFLGIVLLLIAFSLNLRAQTKGFYENVQKKNISKVLDDLRLQKLL
jgi:hypothetical protein